MKEVKLGKLFANDAECKAWEAENLDRIAKENDGVILVVMHSEGIRSDEVVLESVLIA